MTCLTTEVYKRVNTLRPSFKNKISDLAKRACTRIVLTTPPQRGVKEWSGQFGCREIGMGNLISDLRVLGDDKNKEGDRREASEREAAERKSGRATMGL